MTGEVTSTGADATVCWSCGEARAVALCEGCIGWLGDQRSQRLGNRLARAVPILATADVARAVEHYAALGCENLVRHARR